ncbi:MAG: TIGR04282 family arsenosugar biosynthesis glycosyltransferase [Deltaproteobacteria bacterium]|nr:MAG: TIGR04282 family arsenosugar biosynthesis glycosyltransferase [Deltaproteobacteria bacterium]
MKDRCILFFVRNPERGEVKTRLAATLGHNVARDLYRCFILDMLSALESTDFPITICYYPKDALDDVKGIVGDGYAFQPQYGEDLGERMKNGMTDSFAQGFDPVIVIGSDIPDLPVAFIQESFAALQTYDTVIGPALDGGYYLIGFKQESFLPEAFRGIEWGTNTVLTRTLGILRDHQRTAYLLPPLQDIDTLEDLKVFLEKLKHAPHSLRTMTYLNDSEILEATTQ